MFRKIRIAFEFIVIFLISSITMAQPIDSSNQSNARFDKLRNTIFAQPYDELPNYDVRRSAFGKSGTGENNNLLNAARRTLQDNRDLIEFPNGQKLFNANGICFAGQWAITSDSEFTGLFAKGVASPVIVRASVALSGTLTKDKRAFGMAIKFLPSTLKDAVSINLFVLNSMGGAVTKHILDLPMDNQPPLGKIPKWRDVLTALRLRKDLEQADRELGASNPQAGFRPVGHLASYGLDEKDLGESPVVEPKWLRLSALTTQRVDENDFRDEMRLKHYSEQQLVYSIELAADNNGKKSNAVWQTIGTLTLSKSVTSAACDKNLHFKHPTL